MIASWSSDSRRSSRPNGASLFQIRRQRSRRPAKSSPLAQAPGARTASSRVKAGDRVLFGKWSGTEVKIDGVELLIMNESDIMGVLDGPVVKKKAA